MRRTGACLVMVAILVTAGCTGKESGTAGNGTVRIDQQGGSVSVGAGRVIAPPGAVNRVTTLVARSHSGALRTSKELESVLSPIGGAVEISLGGRQPARPLRLQFPLPPGVDPAHLVLVGNHGPDSESEVLPVTIEGDAVTAELKRLSLFRLAEIRPNKLLTASGRHVAESLALAIGAGSARPACAGLRVDLGASRMAVAGGGWEQDVRPPAWPCLETRPDGSVVFIAHANVALPWRAAASRGAALDGEVVLGSANTVLASIFHAMAGDARVATSLGINGTQVLLPEGELRYRFPPGSLPGQIQFKASRGMALLAAGVFAADYSLKAFGIDLTVTGATGLYDCLVIAAKTLPSLEGPPSVGAAVAILRAGVGCVEQIAEHTLGTGPTATVRGRVATLVLSIVSSGAATVWGLIDGALRTAVGASVVNYTVEVAANGKAVAPELLLAPDGLGIVDFNSFVKGDSDREIRILTMMLGAPDDDTGWTSNLCHIDPSSRYRVIRWGPLTTEWWSTEDGSYLDTWHYSLKPQAKPGGGIFLTLERDTLKLRTSRGIGIGSTSAEVERAYPGQELLPPSATEPPGYYGLENGSGESHQLVAWVDQSMNPPLVDSLRSGFGCFD